MSRINVVDQFGSLVVDVKRPSRLCTPVAKNDEEIVDLESHLTCYEIRSKPRRPNIEGPVFISDQFTVGEIGVAKARELCVPSLKNPGETTPTATPVPTGSPGEATDTPRATDTPAEPSATPTALEPTATPSAVEATPTASLQPATPTASPVPVTPTQELPSPTPSDVAASPTQTEAPASPTPTETVAPPSPTAAETSQPTATAAPIESATSTPQPTATPSSTQTAVPTGTPTPAPTLLLTTTPTETATATVTLTPTRTATVTPTATATPIPVCGDGTAELGEECDDGNLVDADGCDSNCTRTSCGNGITTPGEDCDDGNNDNCDECPANCLTSFNTCEATATRHNQFVRVTAPATSQLSGAIVCLEYPDGVVGLPGVGSVPGRLTGFSGLTAVRDFDNAVQVSLVANDVAPELTFTLSFDRCGTTPAPSLTDFTCVTKQASDALSRLIEPPTLVVCTPATTP